MIRPETTERTGYGASTRLYAMPTDGGARVACPPILRQALAPDFG